MSARNVTLFGTLHSTSREEVLGEDAKQSIAVPDRGRMPFPEHVKKYFKQLEYNVNSLESLFKHVSSFTQTEAFMAGSKATTLFRAQHEVVGQLVRCCDAEIEFLSKKLADSEHRSKAAFESPKLKSDSLGWNSVYCTLASLGRVCGAGRGAIFVIPSDCVVSSESDFSNSLKLAAFVSSTKLTPLDKGALHADILDIASTVAATRCSVNAKAILDARRGKHGFASILACPILNPRGSGSPFGVVVLMDKIPPPGGSLAAKLFSSEDEARLSHGSETLAEVLDSFGLVSTAAHLTFISPTNFENSWNVGTHEETVLRRVFQDPSPRGYVFRDDGVAPTTAARKAEMASSRQRVMISQSSQLVDTLKRCGELEDELRLVRSELATSGISISTLEQKLEGLLQAKERTDKHADSMRLANELILRNTFVVERQRSEPYSASPPLVGPELADHTVQKKFGNVSHGSGAVGPQSSRRAHRL